MISAAAKRTILLTFNLKLYSSHKFIFREVSTTPAIPGRLTVRRIGKKKRKWNLTGELFLYRWDYVHGIGKDLYVPDSADRAQAGRKFIRLKKSLNSFFNWRKFLLSYSRKKTVNNYQCGLKTVEIGRSCAIGWTRVSSKKAFVHCFSKAGGLVVCNRKLRLVFNRNCRAAHFIFNVFFGYIKKFLYYVKKNKIVKAFKADSLEGFRLFFKLFRKQLAAANKLPFGSPAWVKKHFNLISKDASRVSRHLFLQIYKLLFSRRFSPTLEYFLKSKLLEILATSLIKNVSVKTRLADYLTLRLVALFNVVSMLGFSVYAARDGRCLPTVRYINKIDTSACYPCLFGHDQEIAINSILVNGQLLFKEVNVYKNLVKWRPSVTWEMFLRRPKRRRGHVSAALTKRKIMGGVNKTKTYKLRVGVYKDDVFVGKLKYSGDGAAKRPRLRRGEFSPLKKSRGFLRYFRTILNSND